MLHAEDDHWPRKIRDQKSTADEAIENDSLFAEAAAIMSNPDAFLPVQAEVEAAA